MRSGKCAGYRGCRASGADTSVSDGLLPRSGAVAGDLDGNGKVATTDISIALNNIGTVGD